MTAQKDVDALVMLAAEALTSVCDIQKLYPDQALFGGPAGFDDALDRIAKLFTKVSEAKHGMEGGAP